MANCHFVSSFWVGENSGTISCGLKFTNLSTQCTMYKRGRSLQRRFAIDDNLLFRSIDIRDQVANLPEIESKF